MFHQEDGRKMSNRGWNHSGRPLHTPASLLSLSLTKFWITWSQSERDESLEPLTRKYLILAVFPPKKENYYRLRHQLLVTQCRMQQKVGGWIRGDKGSRQGQRVPGSRSLWRTLCIVNSRHSHRMTSQGFRLRTPEPRGKFSRKGRRLCKHTSDLYICM